MNQQEINNKSQNPETTTREFFKGNREGDWQADARDLMQGVFYSFEDDEPESLVKVFAILEQMKSIIIARMRYAF